MNIWIKLMRIAFLISSLAFLSLGIAAVPRLVSRNGLAGQILVLAIGLLLPAILAAVAFSRVPYVHPELSRPGNAAGNKVSFAVLSLIPVFILWFLWLVLCLTDSSSGDVREILVAFPLDLMFISTLFVFFAAHSGQTSEPRLSGQGPQSLAMRLAGRLDRLLHRGQRILRPSLLLGIGGVAVLAAPLISREASLIPIEWVRYYWVAAEYGLGHRLSVLQSSFNFLGHASFVVASLLALFSLLSLIGRRAKATAPIIARTQNAIAWAAGILGAFSAVDLYFGWMGFFAGEEGASKLWLWSFFSLGVFLAAVGLALAVAEVASRGSPQSGRKILLPLAVMLYAPVVCANTVFTTFFAALGDTQFTSLAAFYLGVQFLAWGWIQMAGTLTTPEGGLLK